MTVPQLRRALRQHRLEQNLSYEDLAVAIGPDRTSPATLRRFVASTHVPREMTVYAIRNYLLSQATGRVA